MSDPKNILLVEDDVVVALNEEMMLRREGYSVDTVFTGEDAIALVKERPYSIDMILMDINLGNGIDGTEAAQEILRQHQHIPILFLSAHTEREVVEKTEKITSYGYIVKNTGITVLSTSIKMAFRLQAAHQALRRTNEMLSLAQEAGRAGTWEWDIVHNTFDFSPELLKIFGLGPSTQIGLDDVVSVVYPQDRETFLHYIEVLRSKKEMFDDFRIVLPNQEVRWINPIGKIFYDGDQAVRMTGLCIDVTERKQAERALAHSRDLMRYVIEHSRSAIAVHDRNLNYIYVSQQYLKEYKVKEKDVIGKHHYEVFPDLPQKWRDIHQRALAGEVSSAENDPYVREDGSVDWTRWECRPWYEADGAVGGIIVYTEVLNI